MDQIRRAAARLLLRLARCAHADEATPTPRIETRRVVERVPYPVATIDVPVDYEWQEERISALHTAVNNLSLAEARWQRAYREAMTFAKRDKRSQRILGERLRLIFAGDRAATFLAQALNPKNDPYPPASLPASSFRGVADVRADPRPD